MEEEMEGKGEGREKNTLNTEMSTVGRIMNFEALEGHYLMKEEYTV